MSKLYNGGPAFPAGRICIDGVEQDANGMSLRAWLAGQALAGMCSNPQFNTFHASLLAATALRCADAVLVELEKE